MKSSLAILDKALKEVFEECQSLCLDDESERAFLRGLILGTFSRLTKEDEEIKMSIMTKKQREEFEQLARPLIKFLNDNTDPMTHIVIDCGRAEISEGICAFVTDDFIKD